MSLHVDLNIIEYVSEETTRINMTYHFSWWMMKLKKLKLYSVIYMDGSENDVTPEARRFGNRLHGRYGLPVHHVDERLTTKAALSDLRQAGYNTKDVSQQVDSHAARHILQSFLNQM